MKNVFTFLLIFLSTMAMCQLEITQANMPLTGDYVTIAICDNALNPGDAGANQTWDMTWLTESEEQFFDYIQPGSGLLADSFPNANLCGRSWDDSYSYYNVNPTSLTVEGYAIMLAPDSVVSFVYSDKEQIVVLPYAYQDEFLDEFEGVSYIPGFGGLPFDGSLDFEADGYGTLILPTGTYENVVRYHFYREQVNYVGGIPSITQTKEQWAWVSTEYRFWLLLMEETYDGFSTDDLIWYDKDPYPATTGIQDNQTAQNFAFPNPVRQGNTLHIDWESNEIADVSLINMDGKVLKNETISLNSGSNSFGRMDVPAGIYFMKITTDEKVYTQK
ncbi:MAG: T9SS type A sorting domain-containing protein, partial [Bacteroidales bacterium]|nr:T9SS type A sorting domain-containing protein [Bacteroidales bacterium]